MLLLAGGDERLLVLLNALSRALDHLLGTRLAVYGWALYFGNVSEPVSTHAWRNVCVRCGAGHAAATLRAQGAVATKWGVFRVYRCPACDAANPFTPDSKA